MLLTVLERAEGILAAESESGCVVERADKGAVARCHNLVCNNWKAMMSSTGIGRDVQSFHCNKQQTRGL